MSYALWAEGLTKRFGKTTALAGIDLAVSAGTVLGVLGPNGAGKTTAVRVLATLLRPDAGRATVHGLDVVAQAEQVRRMIGLTGQYTSIDEELTGLENLILIGRLLDLPRAQARSRATELLAWFGLDDAGDRKSSTYSGGMRRRLDLAASMVGRPSVIYLDEPTTGLDPVMREELWRMIRSLVDSGVTVLLTTQYLEEADVLADQISVIDHGKVIASGTPRELKHRTGGQTVVVRPTDPGRLDTVATLLTSVVGREPERAGGGTLAVAVDGDAAFVNIVRRLAEAEIPVSELALRLPSLDEVFMALTGNHADHDGPRETR